MTEESKERYKEEFDEGSELLWPSDKEDKVTRKFYRDLSHLSKNDNPKKIESNFIKQIIKLIFGKGSSPINK
tara:strand:+ start:1239 stop:1454 length:216 start_codon:yes stop_codon:yes gene_type:complete